MTLIIVEVAVLVLTVLELITFNLWRKAMAAIDNLRSNITALEDRVTVLEGQTPGGGDQEVAIQTEADRVAVVTGRVDAVIARNTPS